MIFGRRLHNALRKVIEDGDGRTDDQWLKTERPRFEHYACGMYLSGVLAYLEDKYGVRPWNSPGSTLPDFTAYSAAESNERLRSEGISIQSLEALVCIRNAVIHNGGDLSKNNDTDSESTVRDASIPGVVLTGTIVQLVSNRKVDFMEHVRLSLIAVARYYGEG